MLINKDSNYSELIYIGIGSNVGDKKLNIKRACDFFNKHQYIQYLKAAEIIETFPWGKHDQPDFLNSIAVIKTRFSPQILLKELKKAEKELGRTPSEHWGPRVIDMDILLFGNRIITSSFLKIPHAQIRNREFILSQLVDLDNDMQDPETGVLYNDYLRVLSQS